MKKHIILAGTAIATVALCWALCGGTTTVDTIPTPATESAVSAPCAPQTRPTEPSSNNIITEPVTQPETVSVTGSAASPAQDFPQETPVVIPALTSTEESITEPPEKCAPTSAAEVQPQNGMVFVPGFGYQQSEGLGEWSVSESMHENGNKVGIMG